MKDFFQVLRQKKVDVERARKEIAELHFVLPLLAEEADWIENGLAPPRLRLAGTAGCLLGRTVFPYARSGRPRAVVCPADLAVFQQLRELIRREEKLAEVFAQHCSAQGLPCMGFPE
jgi:hypothetical protein